VIQSSSRSRLRYSDKRARDKAVPERAKPWTAVPQYLAAMGALPNPPNRQFTPTKTLSTLWFTFYTPRASSGRDAGGEIWLHTPLTTFLAYSLAAVLPRPV
jgi:hypothetical protein